jgi:hypothetical protein
MHPGRQLLGQGRAITLLERPLLQANMYKHLVLQQHMDQSSFHREARALQLQASRVGCGRAARLTARSAC